VAVVPLSLRIQTLDYRGTSLVLQTISGRRYFVEAAASVDSTAWEEVGEITADDASAIFDDPDVSSKQRFWRYRPAP